MDRNKAETVIKEIEAAIQGVMTRHGLTSRGGRGKCDSNGLTVSFELKEAVTSGSGSTSVQQTKALLDACASYGISPNVLFESSGRTHKLVDYNPRAWKTPFITESWITGYPNSERKGYRWSEDQLRARILTNSRQAA